MEDEEQLLISYAKGTPTPSGTGIEERNLLATVLLEQDRINIGQDDGSTARIDGNDGACTADGLP